MATYVLAQNWTMRIFTFESHVYMACTQIYGRLRVHNVYSSLLWYVPPVHSAHAWTLHA